MTTTTAGHRAFVRLSSLCAAIAVTTTLASAAAKPKIQGIGEASVGYTDNVQTDPETPLPGDTSRTSAAILMLSPGVLLAWGSARYGQRLSYQYEHDFFFAASDSSSSSNRLEYQGFF